MRRDERDSKIPEALITRPEFIAACDAHDIGSVFAMAERFGLSRSAISRMTEIKTDHIREIINGRRIVESFAVYERIADGLGIPGRMLGLAARSWETRALDQPASSGNALDLQAWQLADVLTRSSIDPLALDQMERAATQLAGLYPSTPPDRLMPQVLGLSSRVHEALSASSSLRVRRRAVEVAGVLSGLAGHLYLDLGDHSRAANFYEVGRIAGEEAGNDGLVAWVLTMQSIGQFFDGDLALAIEHLEEAARRVQREANPRRHAWVTAQLARAYAATGDSNAAMRSLDRATSSLAAAGDLGGIDFFDEARLDGIAGTCNLLIGQPDEASRILTEALRQRAPEDNKGRAFLTMDLASCLIATEEIEQACAVAATALGIAADSIVQPIAVRARTLLRELEPWTEVGSVQAFGERLRADLLSTRQ